MPTEIGVTLKFHPDGALGMGATLSFDSEAITKRNILFQDIRKLFQRNNVKSQEEIKNFTEAIQFAAKQYISPSVDLFKMPTYLSDVKEQASITAIISGKGGVGKTSIALGLTEYYSMSENTLLVDFDLHNRGLTSKFGKLGASTSSVLSQMQRFSREILSDTSFFPSNRNIQMPADLDSFVKLRDKFTYQSPGVLHELHTEFLYAEKHRHDDIDATGVRPKNCFFLPSRKPSESFLGSPESGFGFGEVVLFLKYLSTLAHRHGVTRIILDCHGAHDLFMVGAIIAANNLAIVTQADLAAFEGTIELVKFTEALTAPTSQIERQGILVFNEYDPKDELLAKTLFNAFYSNQPHAGTFEDAPKILTSTKMKNMLLHYSKPQILSTEGMKEAIQLMGTKFHP